MRYQLRYVRVPPNRVGDGFTLPDAKIAEIGPPGPRLIDTLASGSRDVNA